MRKQLHEKRQREQPTIPCVRRALAAVCFLLPAAWAGATEEIVIDLGRGLTDALIDFVPPPPGSPDRVSFGREGMRILQASDVKARPTGITGFKSTLAASGDFTVQMDAKIRQLKGPSGGWGHGLLFCIYLDDPQQTVLKLNQVAYPGAATHQTIVEISSRSGSPPFVAAGPNKLDDGKLIIRRRGNEAMFLIQPSPASQVIEVFRHKCPTEDIRTVEVWSTRVDEGNAPTDILVRQVTIEAGGFYTFKKPVLGWITRWQAIIVAHLAVIAAAISYRLWQARRESPA